MTILRRRLRLWIAAWAFCQAASLFSLLPWDCCAHHQPTVREEPCPMHQRAQADGTCVLRATCNAPMAALAALLPQHGISAEEILIRPGFHAVVVGPAPVEKLVTLQPSPETPPPRA